MHQTMRQDISVDLRMSQAFPEVFGFLKLMLVFMQLCSGQHSTSPAYDSSIISNAKVWMGLSRSHAATGSTPKSAY